jgi:hypothetical protein
MNLRKTLSILFILIALLILLPHVIAQQQGGQSQKGPQPQSQSQPNMGGMDMSKMGSMNHDAVANADEARGATDSMSHEHMDMGAHMYMTALRTANAEDEKHGEEIVAALRPSIEKYEDYKVALADGYQIFLPNIPQPQYHFTNWRYAFEAQFEFNPEHPTSLLYKKVGDGYKLLGAMYTAPKNFSENQLNERVPLSVARWHKHVNLCMPPKGTLVEQIDRKQFGFEGSIATAEACEAAGGRWVPQMFGWMVHVYPFEKDAEKVWAR